MRKRKRGLGCFCFDFCSVCTGPCISDACVANSAAYCCVSLGACTGDLVNTCSSGLTSGTSLATVGAGLTSLVSSLFGGSSTVNYPTVTSTATGTTSTLSKSLQSTVAGLPLWLWLAGGAVGLYALTRK